MFELNLSSCPWLRLHHWGFVDNTYLRSYCLRWLMLLNVPFARQLLLPCQREVFLKVLHRTFLNGLWELSSSPPCKYSALPSWEIHSHTWSSQTQLVLLVGILEHLEIFETRRFKNIDIFQIPLEINFSPSRKTNVWNKRLTTSTYLMYAFVIWPSSLLRHRFAKSSRNWKTLWKEWKAGSFYMPYESFPAKWPKHLPALSSFYEVSAKV